MAETPQQRRQRELAQAYYAGATIGSAVSPGSGNPPLLTLPPGPVRDVAPIPNLPDLSGLSNLMPQTGNGLPSVGGYHLPGMELPSNGLPSVGGWHMPALDLPSVPAPTLPVQAGRVPALPAPDFAPLGNRMVQGSAPMVAAAMQALGLAPPNSPAGPAPGKFAQARAAASATGPFAFLANALSGGVKGATQTAPGTAKPTAKNQLTWNFDVGQGAAAAGPSLGTQQLFTLASTAVPGLIMSGGERTAARNLEVGGVANSQHVPRDGHGGTAVDVQPPKGSKLSILELGAQLARSMPPGVQVIPEPGRNHVHIELAPSLVDRAFTQPALRGLPDLSGMMPMPNRPTAIDLPNAPQMATMPARPTEAPIDVKAITDELAKYAPKPFDEKEAKGNRLPQVLAGLARGAASVDARQGTASVLAAIGAGGMGAQLAWTEQTKTDRTQAEEAKRLFDLSLARQGIDLNMANRQVTQKNKDNAWQDQRDSLLTDYTNKKDQWEVETRQFLLNNEALRQYDRDVFQAKTLKAQMAARAVEHNVDLTNTQIMGQQGLDLKRYLFETEMALKPINLTQERVVNQLAAEVGIDPQDAFRSKNAPAINALQGAAYIAANNKPAAINSLAREMVLSQRWDLLDAKTGAEIKQLFQKDPEVASSALGRILNEDEGAAPGTALKLASILAAAGLPMGTMFTKRAKQVPAK